MENMMQITKSKRKKEENGILCQNSYRRHLNDATTTKKRKTKYILYKITQQNSFFL